MDKKELKLELDEIRKGLVEEIEKIIVLLEEELTGQERSNILNKAYDCGSNILSLCGELEIIKNRLEKER